MSGAGVYVCMCMCVCMCVCTSQLTFDIHPGSKSDGTLVAHAYVPKLVLKSERSRQWVVVYLRNYQINMGR